MRQNTRMISLQESRRLQAATWAAEYLGMTEVELEPVSGDASFRRYFRLRENNRSLIVMDAPPEKEDSRPFVDVAGRLRAAGLRAPEIHAFDFDRGFGLLEDFGDTLYREILRPQNIDEIFPPLMDMLEGFARHVNPQGLAPYGEIPLNFEMNLFTDWYLAREKQIVLEGRALACWQELRQKLVESALQQPWAFVHRDFHSCNLLQMTAGPGVIDFQDAMHGPLSYDLVSLLWDRYIRWPRDVLEHWMTHFYERMQPSCTVDEWIRYCDWMGVQRNLKIVGIFARLHHRDGKAGYREMIPQFYTYLEDVLPLYPEFHPFLELLEHAECAP